MDFRFSHPRFWSTWFTLGILWLCSRLNTRGQVLLGSVLGKLLYRVAKHRRHVTEVNIRLCFPELNAQQQSQLVKDTFKANAIGFLETAFSWWASDERVRKLIEFQGLELLEAAKAKGKGVILVGAHFTTLDLAGRMMSLMSDVSVTYSAHKNPLMNHMIVENRGERFSNMIERKQTRKLFRCLKQGEIVWYAPDQDYGRKHAVFVPFFGQTAATLTATSRLANLNGSELLFFSHFRKPDNSGYILDVSAPFKDFPTGDDEKDAIMLNQIIEQNIRKHPEQYMWVHRRFKNGPEGSSGVYEK
jgi:KDO2-lipid IV(A) lauroyltransferase